MKKALDIIIKARGFIFTLVVIALFGYLARQISLIASVTPDQSALDAAQKRVNVQSVKLDTKTINSLKNINTVDGSVNPGSVGRYDPFD